MGVALAYLAVFGGAAAAAVAPWLGVVFSYLIILLTPQNIWWWNFQGLRPIFWVSGMMLVGFMLKVVQGQFRLDPIKNKRNLFLLVLWLFYALSYWIGPYVSLPSQFRFHDPAFYFSVVNKAFILYFVGAICIDEKQKLQYLWWVVVGSVLYLIYWTNDQYLSGTQFGRIAGPVGLYGEGVYSDENAFAMLFVVGLPYVYYLGLYTQSRLVRWILWLLIPFGWHAIFLTGSRGGLLGLGATLLVIVMRSRKKMIAIFLLPALAAAYVWQAGDVMKSRADTIADYQTEASAASRLEAWEAATSMIQTHPLIGVGFVSFGPAFPYHSENKPREAHNTFFQIAAESGVIAGAMYVLLVLSCIRALWVRGNYLRERVGSSDDRFFYAINEGTLVAFSGFVICSLFLSLHVYELFWFLCLMVNGTLYLSPRRPTRQSSQVNVLSAASAASVN